MSSIFVTEAPSRNFDSAKALRWAAKRRGMSPMRLSLEILRSAIGRQRLKWNHYFLDGAWQPGLDATERAGFLGTAPLRAINRRLAVPGSGLSGLMADKVLTDMVLTRAGLPVAPIRAVASAVDAAGPNKTLLGHAALAAFLAETPLPVFGKPVHASLSIGAVSIIGREGSDLILGDGRQVSIADFASEVLRLFPMGYVFQDLMTPHPDLERITGPVIASVRLVTLRLGGQIVPLYTCLKMPGKDQMVDCIASFVNTLAGVDHRTGTVLRGQDLRKMGGLDMAENPVTGMPLSGQVLPDWDKVLELGIATHRLLVRQGIIGADIAITPDGPRIIELNAEPGHVLYHRSFARGFWNSDIAPLVTQALAEVGHKTATRELPFP